MTLRDSADFIAKIPSTRGYATAVRFREMFQRFKAVSSRGYRRLHARALVNTRYTRVHRRSRNPIHLFRNPHLGFCLAKKQTSDCRCDGYR